MNHTTVAYEDGTPITYAEAADLTRDTLDELYPPLTIGELTYGAGRALEAVDPIAFRQIVLEETDYRTTEGEWTEEPPEAEYAGLWHGGHGYALGDWATDAEVFDTLADARAVFEARAANSGHFAPKTHAVEWSEDGTARVGAELDAYLTPCVGAEATLILVPLADARLEDLEREGVYAATMILDRDPRSNLRVTEL